MSQLIVIALVVSLLCTLLVLRWRNAKVGTLEGKAIFITGCDTGFGRLMALSYSAQGALVFAGCLREEAAESLKKEARGDVVAFVLDVARGESVASAFDLVKGELEKRGKQLYGLVNNAGIFQGWLIEMTAMEEFRRVMDVNFMGVVMVTKTMLPLLSLEGRIVTITSVAGILVPKGFGAYSCAKFAANAFMDALRIELANTKIKFIKILPGFYNTRILSTTDLVDYSDRWREASDNIKSRYPTSTVETQNNLLRAAKRWAQDPKHVVEKTQNALLLKNPRTRILVGYDANLIFWFWSLLADELSDFLFSLA